MDNPVILSGNKVSKVTWSSYNRSLQLSTSAAPGWVIPLRGKDPKALVLALTKSE